MRELSAPNGKKIISTIMRCGQVSNISVVEYTPKEDPFRKIEVDIYEGKVEHNTPYLLEFYSYDSNDLSVINLLEKGNWVVIKYKTQSKKNRMTGKTYTTSTLQSINKSTLEEIEKININI